MIAWQVYLEYFSRKQCISCAFHENQRPGGELFAAACGVSRTGPEAHGAAGPQHDTGAALSGVKWEARQTCLKRDYQEAKGGLFIRNCTDRKRTNGYKLKEGNLGWILGINSLL